MHNKLDNVFIITIVSEKVEIKNLLEAARHAIL